MLSFIFSSTLGKTGFQDFGGFMQPGGKCNQEIVMFQIGLACESRSLANSKKLVWVVNLILKCTTKVKTEGLLI